MALASAEVGRQIAASLFSWARVGRGAWKAGMASLAAVLLCEPEGVSSGSGGSASTCSTTAAATSSSSADDRAVAIDGCDTVLMCVENAFVLSCAPGSQHTRGMVVPDVG